MSKAIADPKKAYELVSEVKACWRELSKSGRESTKYAMQIGDLLIRMKTHLPHGDFQKTIEERFDFSYSTAKDYMKLAANRELIEKRLKGDEFSEQLSLRGSMKLIAVSKPKSTSVQGKGRRAALLKKSTEPDGPGPDGDDPNEHCREQIENERATGDMNTPPAEASGDTFNVAELDTPDDKVLDGLKQNPPKELVEVFKILPEFAKHRNAITQIKKWITQTISHPGAKVLEGVAQSIKVDLDNADRALRFARPHSICVYCKNKLPKLANCNACKGHGWITELTYDQAPKDQK